MNRVMPAMREWYQEHVAVPARLSVQDELNQQLARLKPRPTRKTPKVRTPATPDELAAIKAIEPGCVTYVPATSTKRFARQIQGATDLTDAQRLYLWQVVWRFRRQIDDKRLIEIAKQMTTSRAGRDQ